MELKHNPEDAIVNGIQYYPVYRSKGWKEKNVLITARKNNNSFYNEDYIEDDIKILTTTNADPDYHYWEWIKEPQNGIVQKELLRWRDKGYEVIFKGTGYETNTKKEYLCTSSKNREPKYLHSIPSKEESCYYWLLERTETETVKNNPQTATEILTKAASTINNRASERDQESERSMAKTVNVFNALTDNNLSETDGWLFMNCLKMARAKGGSFKLDDYLDGAAYMALAGECEANLQNQTSTNNDLETDHPDECQP